MARKESKGPDVFQILQADHQNVSRIMDELKQAGESQKQQLFNQLQEELNNHMNIEERFFYSRLEEIEELTDLVQDCIADHDDIRQIIQQMNEQDFDSEQWLTNCEALEDSKDDHVDMEEQEVFPQALELCDADVLTQMAEDIVSEKGKVGKGATPGRKQKRPPRAEV